MPSSSGSPAERERPDLTVRNAPPTSGRAATARRLGVAAVALVAIVATAALWAGHPLAALGACGYLAALAVLAEVDLAEHRLPNNLVGPLTGAVALWLVAAGIVGDDVGRSVRALAVGLAVAVAFLAVAMVGDLGMGDVKLALPVGMVAGWLGARAGEATVVATGLSAAVGAAALIGRRWSRSRQADRDGSAARPRLPFGPFLALGALAGLLAAAPR